MNSFKNAKSKDQSTVYSKMVQSPEFQEAKRNLLQVIEKATKELHGIRPAPMINGNAAESKRQYLELLAEYNQLRGRDPADFLIPILVSGMGSGPYLELADGSVKLDLFAGIGISFFGHSHPQLINEVIETAAADTIQGIQLPGYEAVELKRLLLSKVGEGSRLEHCWLTTCGSMANDFALKMIRQKKNPATRVIAFESCFAGRTVAMQEITDKPAYRVGQPTYGEVHHIPFYRPELGLQASLDLSLASLRQALHRHPGKFCAFMAELVQGDGGFNFAPREFYVRLFEEAKAAGLAIWLDEVQTFGRTGELFAYQTFDLAPYVDVVTAAKMLQVATILFTKEFAPKPMLIGGTFLSSPMAMRSGKKIVEMLHEGNYLGQSGKVVQLSKYFIERLRGLENSSCRQVLKNVRGIGGMIAFTPLNGKMEDVKNVLSMMFDQGALAFICGNGPYSVRLLPPFGTMTEKDIDLACEIIESSLLKAAQKAAA